MHWKAQAENLISDLLDLWEEERMGHRRIKGILILFAVILLIAGVWVYRSIPKRADLIITPSTHKEIMYLEIGENVGDSECRIAFALYDPECDYVEICFTMNHDGEFLPENVMVTINGVQQERFSYTTHTSRWKTYTMLLFDEIGECDEVLFAYAQDPAISMHMP